MDTTGTPRRRHSPTGGLILIVVGLFFLLVTLHPEFDPWPILAHYWPVILIVIGLGRIWDAILDRQHPDELPSRRHAGAWMALVILLVLFGLALWKGRGNRSMHHESQFVDLQGAKAVTASIDLPAGDLKIAGGAAKFLDAEFAYRESEGKPAVDYSVSGDHGNLDISGEDRRFHVGTTHNDWDLRFANNVPLELNVQIGAGQSDLQLRDLNVTHLDVKIGAGEMRLDLSGDRKTNLDAEIEGGVGSASIYLPKDVGVKVHATGGIGSVNPHGMTQQDDDYVNPAYGKTPATITLDIRGGIGSIDLIQR